MSDRTTMIKRLLSLTMIISVGLLGWVFFRFKSQKEALTLPSVEKAAQAVMSLSQVNQTATKDGAVQWKLKASSAELETGSGKMVLQNPQVDFFLDDGSRVNLRASKGVLNTQNNDIEVHGNVQVVNSRYTLKTESMAYLHQRRLLEAKTPVHIIGKRFDLKSAAMTYDLDADQAIFEGDIKGTIHEKPAS